MKTVFKKFKAETLLTATLALSAILGGCGMRDPHFALLGRSQSGLISSLNNNKVDILWVIDNSGSMGPKQTNLANSINSFINQFLTKQMDYHIAVVTTDTRPVDPAHPADPNFSGQASCFVGTPTIITSTTPNVATTLASNAQVGFFGSPYAKEMDAVKTSLSEPNLSGCNTGFLRSDAFLAVIMFSDANDNDSVTTTAGLTNFLDTIKPPLTMPNGATVRSYFVSTMGTLDASDLAKPACVASEISTKLLSLSTTTGGSTASICDADFSAGLLATSTKILEFSTAVHLSVVPDPTSIQVYENTSQIANSATNGFTFDSATNSIYFHGSAIPAGAGIALTINYTPADIVR